MGPMLDTATLRATRAGKDLALSPIGLRLLTILMRESPRVVTRRDIEREVWGDLLPDSDTLRSHLYNLRKIIDKPFDVAIDGRGRAWVTGNDSENVAIIDGDRIRQVGGQGFNRPMGIASDSRGNMWIANSALVDVPCPDGGFVGEQYGGLSAYRRTESGLVAFATDRGGEARRRGRPRQFA